MGLPGFSRTDAIRSKSPKGALPAVDTEDFAKARGLGLCLKLSGGV